MALPASFRADGFTGAPDTRFRGTLIGTEGGANTGKTRFIMTGPRPGIILALDRQYRATLESEGIPEGAEDFLFQPCDMAMATGTSHDDSKRMWRNFYDNFYLRALNNRDARTVGIDGDSDGFECQMMAEFGRTTQIPQIQRTALNAARRVYIARAINSNKIVIMTNKVKKKYEKVFDAVGRPVPDPQKPQEQLREWDGHSYERQGWNDHEYCYEIQLRHLYDREREGADRWGLQILMAKANRDLEGMQLWGDECNLPTLLQSVYPHVELSAWGY